MSNDQVRGVARTAPEQAEEPAPEQPEVVAGPQLIILDTEDAPVCENGVCL